MPSVRLTPEQEHVLDALLVGAAREPVQTLGGFAGTGKTTVLAELARLRPNFAVVAPTGKAADVLRRKGVERAETIHAAIYTPKKVPGGGVEFVLRPLAPYSGFLVDEASMVGERLHRDLTSFGVPVIYLGDHGQLPPVNGTLNLMADPTHRLERIHRNAGPIARFAEHLREGGPAPRFDSAEAVRIVSPRDVTPGLILGHDQCIAAYNRTRLGLNRRVREHLGHVATVERGEKVICLRNNRDFQTFNGMQGVVTDAYTIDRRPHLDLETATERLDRLPYDPDQFGRETTGEHRRGGPCLFDYAYCVTCHKAQGDEWDDVLVVEERSDLWEHARWAYTAASRARRSLTWATPDRARRPAEFALAAAGREPI